MVKRKYVFLVTIAILALALLPTSCTCNRSPEGKIPGSGFNPEGLGVSTPKIAYASSHEYNHSIYIMNTDGSNQTRLITDGNNPAWSPDRTRIAFISNRTGHDELYVMNANGSNQIKLTDNQETNSNPTWSPDGTKIVYVCNSDRNDEIYIMDADGYNQIKLADGYYPTWSPDGTKIAFLSRSSVRGVFTINTDGSNKTLVAYIVGHFGEYNLTWSPDGTKLAYDNDERVIIINADHAGTIVFATDIDYNSKSIHPIWSPDGTKIAFISSRDGDWGIYIMNVDSGNQTKLVNGTSPSWSPDSNKIAFVSQRDGNETIYVMNADGSNQTKLADDGSNPVWAPLIQ